MTLAIMQPYFLPYLGYYALIKATDKFIILDEVQYINKGWIARNRILKPGGGWQYILIPVEKHPQITLIKDIKISNSANWQKRIINQLEHYKKTAPYYKQVIALLESAFSLNLESITLQNVHLLSETCKYIGIQFQHEIFSEMDLIIERVNEPDEWSLNIAKANKASCYINPQGGTAFYNNSKFTKNGIELKFLKIHLSEYNQYRNIFEPGLSIIDLMMFNSPEVICEMLNQYEFI